MSGERPLVPRVTVTGIVLAGGRSRRFGADKLRSVLRGRPLVHHPVRALGHVCGEVLVVLPPVGDAPPLPNATEAGAAVRIVRDPEPFGGPLVGLLAGLEHAAEPLALVVAGDMPDLVEPVLAALVRRLERPGADAAVLVLRGRAHPLPIALRVGAATVAARRLLGDGERSLAALVRMLATDRVPEPDWRALDPEGGSVRDVDRPEDVSR